MSSTANHKKMFTILQAAIADKKLLMAVMFQAMRDNPGAIAGAYDKVAKKRAVSVEFPGKMPETLKVDSFELGMLGKGNSLHKCKDCGLFFAEIGIAGACIKCDPSGFDAPY